MTSINQRIIVIRFLLLVSSNVSIDLKSADQCLAIHRTGVGVEPDLICMKLYHCVISAPKPDRVAQSVGHLTRKSGVLGSIFGLVTYFRFSLRFFKKGSCQLLAKVCARSTG